MTANNDFNNAVYENMLKAKKEKIQKNIEVIKAEINAFSSEDNIEDVLDMAELQVENITDQKILHKLESEILEIDAALVRIENGTYGICENTGESIPNKRLMANPIARTIVSA